MSEIKSNKLTVILFLVTLIFSVSAMTDVASDLLKNKIKKNWSSKPSATLQRYIALHQNTTYENLFLKYTCEVE